MKKISNNEFNELEWHDSIIEKIEIDRSRPGENDSIEILISWYDGTKNKLRFDNVRWADLNMNFGIVALESIYDASAEGRENACVKECYAKWNGWIDNISLNYYEIETNSTGSKIQIVAEEAYLSEYPSERQGFRPFSCIFQEKLRILQFIRRLMA